MLLFVANCKIDFFSKKQSAWLLSPHNPSFLLLRLLRRKHSESIRIILIVVLLRRPKSPLLLFITHQAIIIIINTIKIVCVHPGTSAGNVLLHGLYCPLKTLQQLVL